MSYHNQGPPAAGPASGGYQSTPQDQTAIYVGEPDRALFNNKQIRSAFVSKVYTILFFQILAASGLIALFTLHEPTKQYFNTQGSLWLYVSLGVGIISVLILSCVQSARRSFPINFILLTVLTLAYGLIAAIFSARYDTYTVLGAFGATAFATLVIMLMAKYSPFDMTTCGCALLVLGLVHIFAAIILTLVLVPANAKLASVLIAVSGAFLVSLYMMFDMQLIMGGRSVELSPEEYILGAVMLYLDIINLFQYMLVLLGDR